MKTKSTLIIFFFTFCFIAAKSQDLIYKKNNEVLTVKIIEMGIDEVKYKEYNNQSGPTYAIDKNEILKIRFENGKIQIMDEKSSASYQNNRKNAIKIDFLAPLFGQTTFGYERSIKPGASMEFQLGIIGLGVNNYSNVNASASASGGFIRVGYKFITSPDFYIRGMKYAHILKGSYFRPELTYGRCTEKFNAFYSSSGNSTIISEDVNFGAFTLNFGKQWVMNDIFLVDYFVGIGYGFKSNNVELKELNIDKSPYFANSHAFSGPYGGFPLVITGGLKIGFLIK